MHFTRAHATLQEGQESGVVLQQHPKHLGCLGITLGPAVSSWAERHALVYSHPQPQLQLPSLQGQSAPQVQPLQPQVHSPLKSLDSLIVRSSWVVSQEVKLFIPANAPPVGLLHSPRPVLALSPAWLFTQGASRSSLELRRRRQPFHVVYPLTRALRLHGVH